MPCCVVCLFELCIYLKGLREDGVARVDRLFGGEDLDLRKRGMLRWGGLWQRRELYGETGRSLLTCSASACTQLTYAVHVP
jgi:hypothetical protein